MKISEYIARVYEKFSHDIGIDLGTANTLVYVKGRGIVINEPSVVAINTKTGRVVAVGNSAKDMLGRSPAHIEVVRPLVDGVISDFEVAEEMVAYLLNKAENDGRKRFFGPRVVIGVPSQVTNVETRAVRDAARSAGAREVYIVEQPMAGAIGINLPVHDPLGSMVVDIGGGTTDIAVISLGGIVRSKSLKIAGDRLNADIISYVRNEFKILIGLKTAERLKIEVGKVIPKDKPVEAQIKGRDLVTGLPREVVITDSDIREAIIPALNMLIEAVKEILETTPPEILGDVMHRGMYLIGGGALIEGLDKIISDYTKVPVHIPEDPLTAVVRGTGVIIENLSSYQDVLIPSDEEFSN
jgi:rod shape-determining protein MreB